MGGVGGVGCNVIRSGFFTVIVTPHGDSMLSGFVKFHRKEDRFKTIVKIIHLLHSEERKNMV